MWKNVVSPTEDQQSENLELGSYRGIAVSVGVNHSCKYTDNGLNTPSERHKESLLDNENQGGIRHIAGRSAKGIRQRGLSLPQRGSF